MPNIAIKPEQWGRWTVVSRDAKSVTLQCSCGTRRTIERGYWERPTRRWRLSTKCRKCATEVECDRMSTFLFGRKPLPARSAT